MKRMRRKKGLSKLPEIRAGIIAAFVVFLIGISCGVLIFQRNFISKAAAQSAESSAKGNKIALSPYLNSLTNDEIYRYTDENNSLETWDEKEDENTKDEAFGLDKSLSYPGLYQVEGNYVYYVSPYDFKIYKISGNGKRIKLSEDKADYNGILLHGGWIYFINSSKGEKLYRVRTDGKDMIKVSEDKMRTSFEGFFKWKGSLYYYDEYMGIHKIDETGNEVELGAGERNTVLNFSYSSKIYGNILYKWGPDGIAKVDLEYGKEIKLIDDPVYSFQLYRDRIYYINYKNHNLYSITSDGKDKARLIDDELICEGPDYDTGNMVISDGLLYYIKYNESGTGELYSLHIESGKRTVLAKDVKDFKLYGDKLYYIDGIEFGKLYNMKKDGTDKGELTSNYFTYMLEGQNGFLFYGVKSQTDDEPYYGKIFMMDIKNNIERELK